MPRRIDHVDGVVVTVGVEVLRPRDGGGAGVGILRQETGGGGVVIAGVHVEQAGGIRYAPRERHFVLFCNKLVDSTFLICLPTIHRAQNFFKLLPYILHFLSFLC